MLKGGEHFFHSSILSSVTDQIAVSLSHVACSMLLARVLELKISANPPRACMNNGNVWAGVRTRTLLMWQRTYRQSSHLEGSRFEAIRPNRSSTSYNRAITKPTPYAPRPTTVILFHPVRYHTLPSHHTCAIPLLPHIHGHVKQKIRRYEYCLQACCV